MTDTNKIHCGYIALIGQPNVGKSTILNNILQRKVSITSRKPQTTQKQILGIKTTDFYQIVFVDTPGLHQGLVNQQKTTLTKHMARAVTQAIYDVDLIVFIIAGTRWNNEDDLILEHIKKSNIPCVLVINKIDQIKNKDYLLPFIQNITKKHEFVEVFYISALKDSDLSKFEHEVVKYLPVISGKEEFFYTSDFITDQNSKLQASEIIREKIIRLSNKEIPYNIAVEIEGFDFGKTKKEQDILNIQAVIWVQRSGQKKIIIGAKGDNLKKIGTSARIDLENIFNTKVHLELWVKIKSNWSSDDKILKDLGFTGDE